MHPEMNAILGAAENIIAGGTAYLTYVSRHQLGLQTADTRYVYRWKTVAFVKSGWMYLVVLSS